MEMQSKSFSADDIEEIICGLLGDRTWKSFVELRMHIPHEAALAYSHGSRSLAFEGSGAIRFGQTMLTKEALSSLEAKDKVEISQSGDKVRLIAMPRAGASPTQVTPPVTTALALPVTSMPKRPGLRRW